MLHWSNATLTDRAEQWSNMDGFAEQVLLAAAIISGRIKEAQAARTLEESRSILLRMESDVNGLIAAASVAIEATTKTSAARKIKRR